MKEISGAMEINREKRTLEPPSELECDIVGEKPLGRSHSREAHLHCGNKRSNLHLDHRCPHHPDCYLWMTGLVFVLAADAGLAAAAADAAAGLVVVAGQQTTWKNFRTCEME